jgi:hypothetical protein
VLTAAEKENLSASVEELSWLEAAVNPTSKDMSARDAAVKQRASSSSGGRRRSGDSMVLWVDVDYEWEIVIK